MKTWQKYLVGALFAAGIVSRLWGLGEKAFHHDESIHCFYSYELATEGRFKGTNNNEVTFGYNPVYHGPFLYHFSALILFLFGDSDFTARLPFALMGILLLWLVWECRKLVGVPMAIGMLAAATLSPIVNYYSRFAREDINVCTAFFAVPVFAALFLKERKAKDLLLAALSLVIGYSMKESSYIYGFALGFFAVVWACIRLIRFGKPEFRSWFGTPYPFMILLVLYALFSVFVFVFVAVDYRVDPKQHGFVGGVLDIAAHAFSFEKLQVSGPDLREKMKTQQRFFTDPSRKGAKTAYITFAFLVSAALLAGLELLRHLLQQGPVLEAGTGKKKQPESAHSPPGGLPTGAIPILVCGILFVLMAATLMAGMEIVPFLIALLAWVGFEMVRSTWLPLGQTETSSRLVRIAAPWLAVASCLGIILLVYYFLFTQMFADPEGIKRGIYDYIEYWFGHQLGEYRLLGPFWFYIARLLIYEFAFLILAGVGLLVAGLVVLAKRLGALEILTRGVETPGPFNPFFMLLLWMAVFNTLIYGFLHEKAPWLALHQALPWALVAGGLLGWGLSVWRNQWFRMFVILTIVPLALLEMKAHIQVNHNWPDNTAELVSQQQAERDIRDMVKLVDRMAAETGLYEEFPIATEDEVEWPFPWYFRHYTKHRVKTADPNAMVQFGDDKTFTEMRAKMGDKFYYRRYLHRGAWIENSMDDSDLPGGESFWKNVEAYAKDTQFKGKSFRYLFWNYFFHRERWSEINPKWGYVYIRKEMLPTVEPIPAPPGTFDPARKVAPELRLQSPAGQTEVRFNLPRGMRFDHDGHLHIVDSLNGRVVVLSASGSLVRTYGSPGAGPGQLKVDGVFGPSAVAFDAEGNSYVADTWNHRIVKFDKTGAYQLAWGSDGQGTKTVTKFFGPRGVEVGPDGKIYVADTGDCEIEVFNPDGTKVTQFGQRGLKKGDLDEPVGLRFGPDGSLYVADTGNERVQVFTPQGVYKSSWMAVGWASDKVGMEPSLDFLPSGNVVVSLSKKNLFRVYSPKGETAKNFEIAGAKWEPIGVAVGPDGKVWFSDRLTHSIYRLSIPAN